MPTNPWSRFLLPSGIGKVSWIKQPRAFCGVAAWRLCSCSWASGLDFVLPDESHGRLVLFLETSEVMPPDSLVYGFVQALGQRRLFLRRVAALLVGRPKTEFLGKEPIGGKATYAETQKAAILRALKEHVVDEELQEPAEIPFPVVFDMDFGHTDPQNFLPLGSMAEVDPIRRQISIVQDY